MGLSLDRRKGQVICIGDDVTVTVQSIGANKVRVNVHAPKGVSVDRLEISRAKILNGHYPQKTEADQ